MLNYFGKDQARQKSQAVKIKQIPHFMSPAKISQLNFSFNQIRTIPSHITSVLNLQIIDLSHNKINKIEHIFHIPSLKFINLSYNLLTEVPEQIVQLTEIENIDLGFNKISILNNIKMLKQLVELRTFEQHGFIEINLEGNQILKKKGCMEIYKKWMNPSIEQYNRSRKYSKDNRDHFIHLTKKRNSKSMDMPLKDNSMVQTHRTHNISQKMEEAKILPFRNNKKELHQIEYKNEQITGRLSSNLISQQEINKSKRSQIKQNMSIKSEIFKNYNISSDEVVKNTSSLGEWFYICIDKLNELKQNFGLMASNEDINSLDIAIRQKLVEQSLYAQELVIISLQTIRLLFENGLTKNLENKYLSQLSIISQKIKKFHCQILKEFAEKEYLPIRFYKPWVMHYRILKQIIQQIPNKISLHVQSYVRQQQIQDLFNISPQKSLSLALQQNSLKKLSAQSKQSKYKIIDDSKLNQLLFSKNKQEQLLSEHKNIRISSEKKISYDKDEERNRECQNCLMLKWQNTKKKQQLIQLTERINILDKEKEDHIQHIQNLQKFKEKYDKIFCKQQLIIEELQQIQPSTYQNILLQQAKAMEILLNSQAGNSLKSYESRQNRKDFMPLYTSKQYYKDGYVDMNTRLSSNKNKKDVPVQNNKISEFSIGGKQNIQDMITKQSNNIRGSSYFKNKNIITTINRTDPQTQNVTEYLTTQQNIDKMNPRRQIVVSQFNNLENSLKYSENKSILKSKKQSIKQKTENDIILISQNSQTKNEKTENLFIKKVQSKKKANLLDIMKSESFNRMIDNKMVKQKFNEWPISLKTQLKNSKREDISKDKKRPRHLSTQLDNKENLHPNKRIRNKQDSYQNYYIPRNQGHQYIPMNSQEAENYKKYMKYHLRNNIIEILSKKSCTDDNILPQKYIYLSKSQKLINKNAENTHRVSLVCQNIKQSEINKTFR